MNPIHRVNQNLLRRLLDGGWGQRAPSKIRWFFLCIQGHPQLKMKFHGKIKNCYSSVHIIFHIFMMVQITRIFQAQNSSNDKALKIMTIWTTDFPAVSKDRLHHLKQVGIQNAVLQCLQHNRGHSNCNNTCDLFSITQNIKITYTENMMSNDNNKYSIYVYPVYSLVNMGFYTFDVENL